MTATELDTKLDGEKFPCDSAEAFVDDVMGQLEGRDPGVIHPILDGAEPDGDGFERPCVDRSGSHMSGKAFAASAKPLTVRIQRAATVFFSAFAAGPPKVSTGSPLTLWATAFSPTEMSVPLSS